MIIEYCTLQLRGNACISNEVLLKIENIFILVNFCLDARCMNDSPALCEGRYGSSKQVE